MNSLMSYSQSVGMRLHNKRGERLYLSESERVRFQKAANGQPPEKRLLCLVMFFTGCRPSEAINLRCMDFQIDDGNVSIRSLKKRGVDHIREIPVPTPFLKEVSRHICEITDPNHRVWPIDRTTAWLWVKETMIEADIYGPQATAKGLRHGFATHAFMCLIPPQLIQRWLGHARLETTMIYGNIVGPQERQLAESMW